jgi:hypothetical protein
VVPQDAQLPAALVRRGITRRGAANGEFEIDHFNVAADSQLAAIADQIRTHKYPYWGASIYRAKRHETFLNYYVPIQSQGCLCQTHRLVVRALHPCACRARYKRELLSTGSGRTSKEWFPRIFPRNETHVRAMFCGELQDHSRPDRRKLFVLWANCWWAL